VVTGASGYIGQHVLRALAGSGREIIALTRRPEALAHMRSRGLSIDGRGFSDQPPTDLLKPGMSVIHLASVRNLPGTKESDLDRVNVVATERLGLASLEAGVARFVHVSTALIGGDEAFVRTDPYLSSKLRGLERLERIEGLPLVSILPTIVFGPAITGAKNRVTEHIRFVLRSPVLPLIGPGEAPRNLVYVDDVVRAIVRAERSSIGGRHPICGEDVSNREFDRRIVRLCSLKRMVVRVPAAAAFPVARFADILRRFERHCGYRQRLGALSRAWRCERATESEIQGDATPLDEGLQRTIVSLLN
jgi:nucleoside-diphosphate-sugar epimerase